MSSFRHFLILLTISSSLSIFAKDLTNYLNNVIKNHYELDIENLSIIESQYNAQAKKGNLYPKINLTAATVKGDSSLTETAEYSDITISLKQHLYAPTAYRDYSVEKMNLNLAKESKNYKANEILYYTISLMLEYYEKLEHREILNESRKTSRKNLNATKKRMRLGELTRHEVNLTEAQYLSQKTLFHIRDREVIQSKTQLEQYTGLKIPGKNIKRLLNKLLLKKHKSTQITNNNDVKRLAKTLELEESVKSFISAKHYPTLSFIARHGYNDRYENSIGTEKETVFGLSLNIPIYHGGTISSEVSSQQTKITKLRNILNRTKKEVSNTQNNLLNYEEYVINAIDYTNRTINSLTKALNGIKKKARSGDSDKIQIYNQEARIIEFKHKKIELQYQLKKIRLDIMNAQGSIKRNLSSNG